MSEVNYIDLYCTGQRLWAKYKSVIASGGINNVKCRFKFDDSWDGLTKTAVFTSDNENYKVALDDDNCCMVPLYAMAQPGVMGISVYGELGGEIRNTSTVVKYEIAPGAEAEVKDTIDLIKSELKTEMKADISDALTSSAENSGVEPVPDYTEKSYDELIDTVADTTILTAEKQTQLDDWDLVKNVFENSIFAPRALWSSENGINTPYSVPYINTSKMSTLNYGTFNLNKNLKSFGFDVSSTPSTFLINNITHTGSQAENIKITGLQSQINLTRAFNGLSLLESIELYGFNKNHNATSLERAFEGDILLQKIGGDPIDCTGFNLNWSMLYTFGSCYLLEEVRFVPHSVAVNVYFENCSNLTKESVLSIINGLDEAHPGTIYLNAYTKRMMSNSWFCVLNTENDYVYETTEDTSFGIKFTDAITEKGWTIA